MRLDGKIKKFKLDTKGKMDKTAHDCAACQITSLYSMEGRIVWKTSKTFEASPAEVSTQTGLSEFYNLILQVNVRGTPTYSGNLKYSHS